MGKSKGSLSTSRMKQLVKDLEKQGCHSRRTKNGWIIYFPNGVDRMGIHTSQSDMKSVMAMRAKVKRAGLEWPGM